VVVEKEIILDLVTLWAFLMISMSVLVFVCNNLNVCYSDVARPLLFYLLAHFIEAWVGLSASCIVSSIKEYHGI
jgi:hypothetical protein